MTMEEIGALELRSMRAAWRALAERWELAPVEIGMLLPEGGEGWDNPPADTERRMRLLIDVGHGVGLHGRHLSEWLRDPRQDMFFLSPIEAMSDLGHLRHICRMVAAGAFS
ncbi:hypothetical protein [Sphingomonas sp. UYP23]